MYFQGDDLYATYLNIAPISDINLNLYSITELLKYF